MHSRVLFLIALIALFSGCADLESGSKPNDPDAATPDGEVGDGDGDGDGTDGSLGDGGDDVDGHADGGDGDGDGDGDPCQGDDCTPTECEAGKADCNGDGRCESLSLDARCGACDITCADHASCSDALECECDPGYAGTADACEPGAAPTILEQPEDLSLRPNQSATFRVVASGEALEFSWEHAHAYWSTEWDDIGNELALGGVDASNEGYYRVRISNPGGSVVSRWARLNILPLQICSASELQAIGSSGAAEYELTCDIDLSSFDFTPPRFFGRLYGNGHTISGLTFQGGEGSYAGLFESFQGEVRDLVLDGFTIGAGYYAGALTGVGSGWIENVEVRNSTITSGDSAGGIAGSFDGHLVHSRVRSSQLHGLRAGGIAGRTYVTAISHCSVESTAADGDWAAGGLVALADGSFLTDSYARATVSSAQSGFVGGAVGSAYNGARLERVYAASTLSSAGPRFGLAPIDDAPSGGAFDSYWDTDVSGVGEEQDGIGVGTAGLQVAAITHWNGTLSWQLSNGAYPALRTRPEPMVESAAPLRLERGGGQTFELSGTGFDGEGARILADGDHVCTSEAELVDEDTLRCTTIARSTPIEYVRVLTAAHRSSRPLRITYPYRPLTGLWLGAGTAEDPYQIANASDLRRMHAINGHNEHYVFELIADVDLEDEPWSPMDLGNTASIELDGRGHSIFGLQSHAVMGIGIPTTSERARAFFAQIIWNSVVRDLRFAAPELSGLRAAVVADEMSGTIEGVRIEDAVLEAGSAAGFVADMSGTIRDSYVRATFDAGSAAGFVVNAYGTTIERSGAELTATRNSLAGFADVIGTNSSLEVIDSYARGSATALVAGVSRDIYPGGDLSVVRSFAAIDTSSSSSFGIIWDSTNDADLEAQGFYWDSTLMGGVGVGAASGLATPAGAEPRTTTELQTQATFAGWNFGTVWNPPAGGYPTLR